MWFCDEFKRQTLYLFHRGEKSKYEVDRVMENKQIYSKSFVSNFRLTDTLSLCQQLPHCNTNFALS